VDFLRADNGSCERRAKFGGEENVGELLELLHERGGKLRGRKICVRGGKLRGRKKSFPLIYWPGGYIELYK
jgi:hypothetical protein